MDEGTVIEHWVCVMNPGSDLKSYERGGIWGQKETRHCHECNLRKEGSHRSLSGRLNVRLFTPTLPA